MRHMIHMREIRTTVGHIFGANLSNICLLYMVHVVHETRDTHERNSQSICSHVWGKFENHACVICDVVCETYDPHERNAQQS